MQRRYSLEPSDIVDFRPLLGGLGAAKRFLEELSGTKVSNDRVRLKHAYEWLSTDGDRRSFINLRHDAPKYGGGSVGYILRIGTDERATRISHPTILEGDGKFSGAEDPRYFWRGEQLGIIFNALCCDSIRVGRHIRRMFIYFDGADECIRLEVPGFPFQNTEKNWTVLVIGTRIYLIYCFNPLVVFCLEDESTGHCSVVSMPFPNTSSPIRPLYPFGGSSLWPLTWPYFIALVHTTNPYRPAILVFDAEEMHVRAIGQPFSVPEPAEAIKWRGLDVQYPYHLELKNGECNFWIECQDRCPTKYQIDCDRFSEVASSLIAPGANVANLSFPPSGDHY